MQRKLIPKLETSASLSPSTIDVKNRTVELVWSTGAKGLRSGEFGTFYESLDMSPAAVDMSRMQNMPLLDSHDGRSVDSILGVVQSARIENGVGIATVRFASDAKSESVFQKVIDGVIRNVSVGYRINEMRDVSGVKDKTPSYLATRWTPLEISLVSVPFDSNATIRSETQELNEVQIIGKAEKAAIMSEENQNPTLAERNRIASITRACRAAQLDAAVASDFIERGVSAEEASQEIFKRMADKLSQTSIRNNVDVTSTREDAAQDGIVNATLHRMNPRVALTEAGKHFVNYSLLRNIESRMGRRLGESEVAFASRAMTNSDLPNILANVAEKAMRSEFALQAPTFKPFVRMGSLRNYKAANRLMLGEFPSLEVVSEGGEATMGYVSESKETIQLKRYLKQIAFTKEMIINDDLNALSDFATKGARAANRVESSLVYSSILGANPVMGDGFALFSTEHANFTSTGTAMSVTSLAIGWTLMRNQKTIDGLEFADLTPKYLICGPAREVAAIQVVSQNMLSAQVSNVNPFSGRLEVIVDPRITGNEWYLAADPSQIDTIEVARLESETGPMITSERGRIPGSTLITLEHSVGAQVLDFRGLYRNNGA